MRSFGISVGIAGLARLLRVLFPAHPWLCEVVAALAAVVLAVNLVFVLANGLPSSVTRLVAAEEGAYAGWSACTLALLSTFRVFAPVGDAMWLLSVVLGVVFAVLGVRDLWRTRHAIDPGHLSWFAWLGVTAATIPASVTRVLPDLSLGLTLTWFAVAVFVLVAAWRCVARNWSFRGARSPWFAPGGASGLALWSMHHAPQSSLVPLLAVVAVLGLVWLIPVLQLVLLQPTTRAAWPNLFPLTSIAYFCADSQWTQTAGVLAAWATLIAAIEVKNHVPTATQHLLQQLDARREARQASA